MIGRRLGNYEVLSLLGRGGMGAVYLARHPEIGREVAIKVILPEQGDPHAVARLLNEARITAALRHPNIVEVLDLGMASDGRVYVIMELLEGHSLRARLDVRTALETSEAIEFAYQIASALAAAHERRVVHRDLKPENLFVVHEPGTGIQRRGAEATGRQKIKIFDFGIAKLERPVHGTPFEAVKTRAGTMLGTPAYMSPEQCRGCTTIDGRSDMYSLGVILYEMLCGKPPFQADHPVDVAQMQVQTPPPPPRSLRADIPDLLEAAILKMLAKRPEDRYASMTEIKDALRAVTTA